MYRKSSERWVLLSQSTIGVEETQYAQYDWKNGHNICIKDIRLKKKWHCHDIVTRPMSTLSASLKLHVNNPWFSFKWVKKIHITQVKIYIVLSLSLMRLLRSNSASLGILVSLYCFSGYMHINTQTAQKPHVHQSPQHSLSSWHLPSIGYKTKPETFTKWRFFFSFSFSTNGQLKCLWPEMLELAGWMGLLKEMLDL